MASALEQLLEANGFGPDSKEYQMATANQKFRDTWKANLQKGQTPTLAQGTLGALINGGVAGLARVGGADHAGAMRTVEAYDPIAKMQGLNAALSKYDLEGMSQDQAEVAAAVKRRSIDEILNPKPAAGRTATPDPTQIRGPGASAPAVAPGIGASPGMPGTPSGPAPDRGASPAVDAASPPSTDAPADAPITTGSTPNAASAQLSASASGGGLGMPYNQRQIMAIATLDPDLAKRLEDANKFGLDLSKHELDQAKYTLDRAKFLADNDPDHATQMQEARTTGELQAKAKGEKTKMDDAAGAVGAMVDELEGLADSPDIEGAIGPVDQTGIMSGVKGFFGAKSYNVGAKVDMLTRGLELKMTRLLMQGQGQITEGERAIVRDHIGNLRAAKNAEDYRARVKMLREVIGMQMGRDLPSNASPEAKQFAADLAAARAKDPRVVDPASVDEAEKKYEIDATEFRNAQGVLDQAKKSLSPEEYAKVEAAYQAKFSGMTGADPAAAAAPAAAPSPAAPAAPKEPGLYENMQSYKPDALLRSGASALSDNLKSAYRGLARGWGFD